VLRRSLTPQAYSQSLKTLLSQLVVPLRTGLLMDEFGHHPQKMRHKEKASKTSTGGSKSPFTRTRSARRSLEGLVGWGNASKRGQQQQPARALALASSPGASSSSSASAASPQQHLVAPATALEYAPVPAAIKLPAEDRPQRDWLGALFGSEPAPSSADETEAPKVVDEDSSDGTSLLPLSAHAMATLPKGMLINELVSWDVDIFAFDPSEVMQLAALIFRESGVLTTFSIQPERVSNFLAMVGGRYRANPYHNFYHGCHVLLTAWLLAREELRRGGASGDSTKKKPGRVTFTTHEATDEDVRTEALSQLQILSLLVGAMGHDVDHPGVTNAYLVNAGAPLAIRYNDVSVLENHHAATTSTILGLDKCNMFDTLELKQRREARSLLVSSILATDMAHHSQMIKELTQYAADHGASGNIPAAFTLQVMTHVADLSNCALRWELSRVWARRVCDEATNQAQKEHDLGLPVEKLTPYSDEELMTRQLVFLDGWVRPLFNAAALLYVGARDRLPAIRECRSACKSHLGQVRLTSRNTMLDRPSAGDNARDNANAA
jgi:hypothetical protein